MPESASRGGALSPGGRVCSWGACLTQGVCVSAPGVSAPRGGMSDPGGVTSMHALRQTPLPPPPREQNDRQVWNYYLGHNFVAAGNYTICDSVKCCLVIQTWGDFPLFSAFFCFGTVYVSLTRHEDSFVVVWGPRFSLLPRHSRSPCEVPSLIYCGFLAENIDPLFLLIRYHDKLDSVLQFKNICLILIDCNFFYLKGLYGTLENIWNKVNPGKSFKVPCRNRISQCKLQIDVNKYCKRIFSFCDSAWIVKIKTDFPDKGNVFSRYWALIYFIFLRSYYLFSRHACRGDVAIAPLWW